jgi:hypothetical protein
MTTPTLDQMQAVHPMDSDPKRYIGTVQQEGGMLIWHVFERITP